LYDSGCMRAIAILTVLLGSLAAAAQRPRIVVLTDISSLTADVREPDDGQSLIRLLMARSRVKSRGAAAGVLG